MSNDNIAYTPLGYQQLAVNTATSLTVPATARLIEVIVEAQGIRYRDDGVAPTATVGMPVAAGSSFVYSGNLNAIQFIAQVAGGIVNVSYYRFA